MKLSDESFLKRLRIATAILAFVAFVSGLILSWQDKAAAATANYSFSALMTIFSFLPEFERFKGFGMEGVIRQKLTEADKIIQQLRAISIPMTELLFTLIAQAGRPGRPISKAEEYELVTQIEKALQQIGAEPDQIIKAKKGWGRITVLGMATPVINEIISMLLAKNGQIDIKVLNECLTKLTDMRERIEAVEDLPRNIKAVLETPSVFSDEEKEHFMESFGDRIDDLETMVTSWELRRPKVWIADKNHIA